MCLTENNVPVTLDNPQNTLSGGFTGAILLMESRFFENRAQRVLCEYTE